MILKILKKHKVGSIFSIIQTILSVVFIALIIMLNALPTQYFLPITIVFVLLDLLVIATQLTKKLHKVGKVISCVISILLLILIPSVYKGYSALNSISGSNTKIANVSVIVMKDDAAQEIEDTKDYKFGILELIDRENTDKTLANINDALDTEVATTEYTDVLSQVKALYSEEVNCIVLNETYRTMIEDEEDYKTFSEDTRIIETVQNEEEVKVSDGVEDITSDCFSFYISGIDTEGSISTTSRSDVNIIATVNPVTKQILLTSTPRDYYIPLANTNGVKDKLTHAGNAGVDNSVETLEMLYNIDIDFYGRVNFTGFKKIVDALGGVTVHSDYTFKSDWGPSFVKGDNVVNGSQALAFARERHTFSDGDNQRGKNQQYLIQAIIEKATSPAILTGYASLLDGLSEYFQTNMEMGDITSLVKMQLDDMASWNVVMVNAKGSGGGMEYTYSMPNVRLSVMYKDEESIQAITKMMNMVIDGEKISDDTYDSLMNPVVSESPAAQ